MHSQQKRVALVTGSRRGIGRGVALRLAGDGFRVVVNGVTEDSPASGEGMYEVKRLIEEAGGEAAVFRADISLAEEREAMVDFIVERFGRIDLLVNNAGVAPEERRDLLDATERSFDRVLSVNLKGPYFLTQRVAKLMVGWKASGVVPEPRIAFISSVSAYTSSTARGEYCVSKAGLSMAAKVFAHRLGEHGIPVIEIAPGIIDTPMTAGVKDKYNTLISQGILVTSRWGLPEDVAKVVSAFARGDLDYSTGETIEVGGGFGIRRL